MQLPDGRYLFGRVIDVDLPGERSPTPNAHLLYIYHVLREEKMVDPADLTRDKLLIPPIYTNRLGWVRGYFETIGNWPLTPTDVLEQHCFWDVLYKRYVDGRGDAIAAPREPCGEWALASYPVVDEEVSEALGIAPASTDPT
jgi:hypothetical protein